MPLQLNSSDLNDFIAPSAVCIKPSNPSNVRKNKKKDKTSEESEYRVNQPESDSNIQVAKITLNDCLACSGCITSAETMLISMQGPSQVYQAVEDPSVKMLIFSISPQTRASFAAKYNLTQLEVVRRLEWFLVECLSKHSEMKKPVYVVDTSFSRDIALLESAREFINRLKAQQTSQLPMLTSACPGWICYAEKTHGELLPLVSTTKSPQQIMGSLVKQYLPSRLQTSNITKGKEIFHVSLMPCFDKKLEASRSDFYDEKEDCKQVDCVISSLELEQMISEKCDNRTLADLPSPPAEFGLQHRMEFSNYMFTTNASNNGILSDLWGTSGSSSGGYLEHVMRLAIKELYPEHYHPTEWRRSVQVEQSKSADYTIYRFSVDGSVKLAFVKCFGFRHIQNIVRRLKTRRGEAFHFIEIMACPRGCINGGGQLRPTADQALPSIQQQREFVDKAESVYADLPCRLPEDNQAAVELWPLLNASNCLQTEYHNVKDDSEQPVERIAENITNW